MSERILGPVATYFMQTGEAFDVGHDWTEQLEPGETLTASSWQVVPAGLTTSNDEFEAAATVVWLGDDGTVGVTYSLVNTVETSEQRRYIRWSDVVMIEPGPSS